MVEGWIYRLVPKGTLIESIAEETEGEDCRGEGIAGQTGIAIEQLCKDFVMIFCMWKSLDIA